MNPDYPIYRTLKLSEKDLNRILDKMEDTCQNTKDIVLNSSLHYVEGCVKSDMIVEFINQ